MVKKHAPHRIVKRPDGRFEVRKRGGGNINGIEKLKILVDAGVVKAKIPAPKAVEGGAEAAVPAAAPAPAEA